MNSLKKNTLIGFLYKFAERGASQLVSFLVQIILARILMPEEFGTIALLTVFITILDVFVTYGFGNSLIVNKDSDDVDFSTCFYFGLFLSLVLYVLVFLFSSHVSQFFYGTNELSILVNVMALRMPIAAVNTVQHAYIAKAMRFKLFFYATFIGTVLSGVLGIAMAYAGLGVWALVAQYLSNSLFNTIALFVFDSWKPKWVFSFYRLKAIYDYGWKILVVGLSDTIFSQLRSLVIAKQYSRSDLAHYNRGISFPYFGIKLLEPTISGVLFPSLSNCNDDQEMMKSITRRTIKISTYLTCAIMFFLMAVSKPLVIVVLTEKWLPCVQFIQIGCLAYMLRPVQVINTCVIRASGKSGLLLKLDIFKKVIGIILLLLAIPFGVVAIAFSYVAFNVVSTIINIYPNKSILGYGYFEQMKDLIGNLLVGASMGILVWSVNLCSIGSFATLILQCLVGMVSFVLISKSLKVESFSYMNNLILNYLKK